LTSGSIANIVGKILHAAGIRQSQGERRGTHIFRHYLASSLLENGIPQPVISKVLGHTAPNSLEPYLRADFIHLKECALSIDCFPVFEEVFII
jgi:integrase